MTQRFELLITGLTVVALILGIGALKTAGIVDEQTAAVALGLVTGGGFGWGGKTVASTPTEKPTG
jgi:hypothetical protein